jgi:AmiR/NasT family two-component response regulator
MEVTKEYLDAQFAQLSRDISGIKETMATRQDLRDATDELARMVNAGFEEAYRRLDVREQVERHERVLQEIKQTLKLA